MKNEPIVMPSPEMVEEYVNKAVKAAKIQQLEQLKAEIENLTLYRSNDLWGNTYPVYDQKEVLAILDKNISELKGSE